MEWEKAEIFDDAYVLSMPGFSVATDRNIWIDNPLGYTLALTVIGWKHYRPEIAFRSQNITSPADDPL